jgi:hypothetical protein
MRYKFLISILLASLSTLAISGCGTSFRENHYFSSASDDPGRERKTNYFRVTVDGWAAFSAARYVSGYYDERAVDLFFNEVKAIDGTTIIPPLFQTPSAGEQIRPLSPDQGKGALVMILSTNADVVADAIGNFAEGQAAAAAISNLVNRDEIRMARRTKAEQAARERGATALATEVGTFMSAMAPAQEATFLRDYLRVANALGRELDPPVSFASLEEVAAWHRRRMR